MSGTAGVRVLTQEFHRNGSGAGEPFVVSLVDWISLNGGSIVGAPLGEFVVISFFLEGEDYELDPNRTAVLSLAQLSNQDVMTGWRGADYVGPAVAEAWHNAQVARRMSDRLRA